MSVLMRCYPGDRALDGLLVVALGVALASCAAWLVSRRLAGRAALRHLVLLAGLICCLATPALAWLCAAANVTVVSIPLLGGEQGTNVTAVGPMKTERVDVPSRQGTDLSPTAAGDLLPRALRTMETSQDFAASPAETATSAGQSPPPSTPRAEGEGRTVSSAGTSVSFRGIATAVMLVWASGTLLTLACLARNCLRVVRLRRASRAWQNAAHQARLTDLAAKRGTRQVPLLLASNRTVAPLAVGFGPPAIILPETLLAALGNDELEDILVHEAAHLHRGDQWIVLLQELAAALYWPIPSLHRLNRELGRAREELCDNFVLAGRNALRYGETLLRVAELIVEARRMRAVVGMIGRRGDLERRVVGLIDPRRNTMTTTSGKTACVVIFAFLAGGAITSTTRFAPSARAEVPGPGAAAEAALPEAREKLSTPPDDGAQAAPADPQAPDVSALDDPKFAVHFRGRVTGPDGKPVRGARVFFVAEKDGPGDAPKARATTGTDGRFEFDAPDMTVVDLDGLPTRRQGILSATADGYAPDWRGIWGRPQAGTVQRHPLRGDLTLQLAPDDLPIHGQFLDPDGQPLAGALVRLTGLMIPQKHDLDAHLDREKSFTMVNVTNYERELFQPRLVPALTSEIRTDADGRFTLSGLGRDRLAQLMVSAPRVVDTTLVVMTRDAPDVATRLGGEFVVSEKGLVIHGAGFSLKLKPGRTISGVVRDVSSKKPIAGMWVGLRHVEGARMWVELSSKNFPFVTDENGRFTITGLFPTTQKRQVVAIAPPGVNYQARSVEVVGDAEVVVEIYPGIPFHLKLADEAGRPVDADVTYVDLWPNPYSSGNRAEADHWPVSRAARKPDGTYEGFVLSGPGAVLVQPQPKGDFRPARVDPKAFFAPGWTDTSVREQFPLYGTRDTLTVRGPNGSVPQNDYAAIVLINPAPNSAPLELSATLDRSASRRVSLIDQEGQPVVGARTTGMNLDLWNPARTLRAASFSLTGLHPDRVQHITFFHDDRRLIGFLPARGDGDSPYTVVMQPWGTVVGRLVDENGKALPIWKPANDYKGPPKLVMDMSGDPERRDPHHVDTDAQGRFRIDKLVPGLRYSAKAYHGMGPATETVIENLVLSAGDVRDLGDVSTTLSFEPSYKRPSEEEQRNAANVPAGAWGEPVNGLRVAIVLRSPAVDKYERLGYDIVVDNVSDHDIRFGAGNHYEYGFSKMGLVDTDGEPASRVPGALPNWVDTLPWSRYWLKPGERTVLSPSTEQLVKLDAAGKPIPPPKEQPFYHVFHVKPGRYSVSAAVEFGSGMQSADPATGAQKVVFAAKGEWTGKLQTGVVAATLFEGAGK